jgi:putative ABC transport system ATP-binding protein
MSVGTRPPNPASTTDPQGAASPLVAAVTLVPEIATQRQVLFHLEDVGRTFYLGEVAVEVLRHVELDIFSGELVVLVGPSGSGKTTLLNLVGGLDTASAGRVLYRGQDLADLGPRGLTRFRRDKVGFVFQFYNLVPNLTARENVLVATELSDAPLDVDETLRLVGLEHRMDHFPSQLSGGEQQRVAIARALAKNPELLLCDEPTGALDFETGKHVLSLLLDVKQKLGKTVVIITHNLAIGQIADRVLRMRSGEIVEAHVNTSPVSPEEIVW